MKYILAIDQGTTSTRRSCSIATASCACRRRSTSRSSPSPAGSSTTRVRSGCARRKSCARRWGMLRRETSARLGSLTSARRPLRGIATPVSRMRMRSSGRTRGRRGFAMNSRSLRGESIGFGPSRVCRWRHIFGAEDSVDAREGCAAGPRSRKRRCAGRDDRRVSRLETDWSSRDRCHQRISHDADESFDAGLGRVDVERT